MDWPGMGAAGLDDENPGHGRGQGILGLAPDCRRAGHCLVYRLAKKGPAEEQIWPELSVIDLSSKYRVLIKVQ